MESEGLFFARGDKAEVEGGDRFMPKFDADGLIPCVTCDHTSGEVLMVAYMNRESLTQTMQKGEAVYWSRSRQELWHKGATSGQVQTVRAMRVDCDQDCLVISVDQAGGGACHTGHRSCFYREVDPLSGALKPLE